MVLTRPRRIPVVLTLLEVSSTVTHYAIETVQERLGQKEVSTTMIYTHVLNRGGRGVRSPADRLDFGLENHWGKPT